MGYKVDIKFEHMNVVLRFKSWKSFERYLYKINKKKESWNASARIIYKPPKVKNERFRSCVNAKRLDELAKSIEG